MCRFAASRGDRDRAAPWQAAPPGPRPRDEGAANIILRSRAWSGAGTGFGRIDRARDRVGRNGAPPSTARAPLAPPKVYTYELESVYNTEDKDRAQGTQGGWSMDVAPLGLPGRALPAPALSEGVDDAAQSECGVAPVLLNRPLGALLVSFGYGFDDRRMLLDGGAHLVEERAGVEVNVPFGLGLDGLVQRPEAWSGAGCDVGVVKFVVECEVEVSVRPLRPCGLVESLVHIIEGPGEFLSLLRIQTRGAATGQPLDPA